MFTNKSKKELEEISNASNVISKGTVITGNIESFGNIRIEGHIIGNITSKNKVVLGESSIVEGHILAQNAEVSGKVEGTLEVSEMLLLKPTANIEGDIVTNKLTVEAGANFNGSCNMGAVIKDITLGTEGQKRSEKTA